MEPEFNMVSIYPLSDIKKIYEYNGPFDGIEYDSKDKIKVARELARSYAEAKPRNRLDSYYPTNEEMSNIVKMIKDLMKKKTIIKAIPREDFRFSSIIDFYRVIKESNNVSSYQEMIDNEKAVKKIIRRLITI